MTVFVLRRLIQSIVVILIVSLLVFLGVYSIGNPADILISSEATQSERDHAIKALGLDKPVWEQYGIFLSNALKGDLGRSFVFNEPTLSLIFKRMPATLELAFSALFLSLLIGIPLGMLAGYRANSLLDRTIMTGSILGFSAPTFWTAILLIMIFSVGLGWLPSGGRGTTGTIFGITTSLATWDGIRHMILPVTSLSLFKISLVTRLTRSGVRETLPMDFVKFARAKGLRRSRIMFVHVFKNVLIPIVTVVGMELGSLIAFGVVTETIYAWPGTGKLLIDSINRLDRPMIVAWLMITVMMFIVINLIVDLSYSLIDPRIRLQRRKA
ncbi:MAG: ABC transporter permease [Spirochaetota bacterium]